MKTSLNKNYKIFLVPVYISTQLQAKSNVWVEGLDLKCMVMLLPQKPVKNIWSLV